MKIVDLKTFRALPIGTICMKYEPCIFGELFSKGETWEHDFCLEYITNEIDAKDSGEFFDKLFVAQETGCSVTMDFDATTRDGLFENAQLFAVYEKEDVIGLIDKLNRSLCSYT